LGFKEKGMERVKLIASRRKKTGKGDARRLRRMGLIPAILYGGGENIPLQLNAKELSGVFSKGENVIVNLSIEEDKGEKVERTVILKDKQIHPIERNWIHVDFYEISLEEKLETKVPVTICGVSRGIEEGGILEHITREITVRCLPTKIPEHIEVDISKLGIGDTLSIEDLKVDEDIEILDDAKKLVVHILPPIVEKEEVAEERKEPEKIEEKEKEEE
jgi:large subunit ribosomal protein L25